MVKNVNENMSNISKFSLSVNDNSAYFGKVISNAMFSSPKKRLIFFSEKNIARRESEISKKPLPLSPDAQQS